MLGGRRVRWLGIRGCRWKTLLRLLFRQEGIWGRPDWLIIHLGGNDLGAVRGMRLIVEVRDDLSRVQAAWPEVWLVWSDIVPRLVWRGVRNLVAIDRARKKVNMAVSRFVRELGGLAVRHKALVVGSPDLFLPDGVHLFPSGMRSFFGVGVSLLLG